MNDLLLAAVTGGLRTMLLARGTPVEGLALYASVPVALRAGADTAALGNQVGLMVVPSRSANPTRPSGSSASPEPPPNASVGRSGWPACGRPGP